VVVGARPLVMTDYIACGKVVPERIADIVRGIAEACALTGTALVGGETAEHPGLLGEDEYDVAGAATGVVEADRVLGPDGALEGEVPERGRTVGEELLEPPRLYTRLCLELAQDDGLHALSHVTGGGLAANLARVLPSGLVGHVDRGSWQVPPVFDLVRRLGPVEWDDLRSEEHTS